MNDTAFLLCPDLGLYIKKWSTYQPSQFSGQKGEQTFYFLGLILGKSPVCQTMHNFNQTAEKVTTETYLSCLRFSSCPVLSVKWSSISRTRSEIHNQVRESIWILPVEFCKNPILPYYFEWKTGKFTRIHLDSCNFVDENLYENGFLDSRQISDPVEIKKILTPLPHTHLQTLNSQSPSFRPLVYGIC